MTRQSWAARAFVLALLLTAAGVVLPCAAQPSSVPSERTLRFRKIFIPEGRNESIVPRDCRTLAADQFFEWLTAISSRDSQFEDGNAATITRAKYSAKYADGALEGGLAVLDVEVGTRGAEALPLAPLRLAVVEATWLDEVDVDRPARLGLRSDGRVVALGDLGSQLQFRWSLRGATTDLGDVVFDLQLPTAPSSQLTLVLPADKRPVVDVGVVSLAPLPADNQDASPESAATPDLRTWVVELGGHSRVSLRITTAQQWVRGKPLILLSKQQLRYELSPRGLLLSADLALDVYYEPLSEVAVTLANPLQLISARVDDDELEWVAEFTDDAAARLVTIRLPSPITGSGRTLRLTCVAPMEWDKRWRLPTMKVEDARWQQGQATVEIPDGVVLKYFDVRQGRETAVEPLPNKGQLHRIQLYSPRPWLEVHVSGREAEAEASAATSLHFTGASLNATVTIDLSSQWGDVYEASTLVPKAWLIDAVESLSEDVGFRFSVSSASATMQRLKLQLQRPVSINQTNRFRIRAHREAPSIGQPISLSQLRLADFRDVPTRRHVWAITNVDGFQVRLSDDSNASPLRIEDITASERTVLPVDTAELLLLDNSASRDASILFVRERPAFSSESLVTVEAGDTTLKNIYNVRIYPRSTPLRRVLIHLSEAHDSPVSWKLPSADEAAISATKQANGESDGETWEILLPTPQSRPFELQGTAISQFDGSRLVSLASLPESDSQIGRLVVIGDGEQTVAIDAPDLKPIPADTVEVGKFRRVIGKYRYEPSHESRVRIATAEHAEAKPRCWVWRRDLVTRPGYSGVARHVARMFVENLGRSSITMTMPADHELEGLFVNGKILVPMVHQGQTSEVIVPLPDGVRFPLVELHYQTPGPLLRDGVEVTPHAPQPEVPLLASYWQLWLPPSFDISNEEAVVSPQDRWQRGVEQLLFDMDHSLHSQLPMPPILPTIAESPHEQANEDTVEAQRPIEQLSPWPAESAEYFADAAKDGWQPHATALPASSASAPSIRLAHRPTRRSFGWATILLAAAVVWRIARTRLGMTVLFAIAAWTGLIVGPITWLPVFAGVLLGIMLGWLLGLATPPPTYRRARHPGEASTASATPLVARLGAFLAAGAALLWCAQRLAADESEKPPAPTRNATVYPVYIPVDDARQPTGDYVYLPREFHDLLKSRAAARGQTSGIFQLNSASYETRLVANTVDTTLSVAALTGTFEVFTLESDVTVVLPIHRNETQVSSIQLDGEPISIVWDATATSISVTAAEAGEHRIDVFMQPRTHSRGSTLGFDIQVPAIPRSQLRLSHPETVSGLRFPTAIGQVIQRTALGETQVDLGPAKRLVVEWPSNMEEQAANSILSADQYTWMHVRPGSVLVDAKLTFHTSALPIRTVQLRADPRLSLLPLPNGSNIVEQRVLEGSPRTIRLLLDKAYEREVSVHLRFVLESDEALEISTLTAPNLAPVAKQIGRNWLAVSLPPGMVAADSDPIGSDRLDPNSFAASWGEPSTPPLLAYSLSNGDMPWSLPLRRQSEPMRANQQLDVSIGSRQIEFAYQCRLAAADTDRFQYRFQIPANFQADSAVVRSDVTQRIRPALDGAGHLTLFLNERPRGDTVIQVTGTLATPLGQTIGAPAISLEDADPFDQRIRIYRKSDVSVRIVDDTASPSAEVHPKFGRLLVDWAPVRTTSTVSAPPTIRLGANNPQISVRTVTEMIPRDDAWQASLDLVVNVAGGFADQLRLDFGSQWTNVSAIDANDVQLESRAVAGQASRQLIIRPSQPLRGEFRLRMTGDIPTSAVDIVQVPDITVPVASSLDRYVVLPTDVQQKQIDWEISGLRESELPDDYSLTNPTLKGHSSFQVVGPTFQAKIVRVERALQAPQVRLADVFLHWSPAGQGFGAVTIDLEPAGLSECRLAIPSGCRVLHVLVGDVVANCRTEDKSTCTIPLSSRELPQRVEVVFTCDGAWTGELNRRASFAAPHLIDIPVERTLWTLTGDSSDVEGAVQVAGQISAVRQEMFRLDAINELIDLASDLAAEGGAVELENWYRRWIRRYQRSRVRLRQRIDTPLNAELESALAAIDEQQNLLAERLRTSLIQSHTVDAAAELSDMSDVVMISSRRDPAAEAAVHCMYVGSRDQIEVSYRSRQADEFWKRLSLGVVIAGLVITVLMLRRYLPFADWSARWPYALGVIVGLAWYLWLPPGYLGWVIVAISVLGSVRLPAASQRWPRVSEHASTVIRGES